MIEENVLERYSKQDVMKIYSISRHTFDNWWKNYDLPVICISSHSKFVRKKDLERWEDNLIAYHSI